jgi:hypothetical protein
MSIVDLLRALWRRGAYRLPRLHPTMSKPLEEA